jgi:hypothetical protein
MINSIFLYRAKTGVPVNVVIPNEVGEAPRTLPNSHPSYFFWSGNGDPRSAAKAFQRSYWDALQIGEDSETRWNIETVSSSYVPRYLCGGVAVGWRASRSSVPAFGHSSVKITERHYAPFLQSAAGTACRLCQTGVEATAPVCSTKERVSAKFT